MKRIKWLLLLLLFCTAVFCASYTMKPLVHNAKMIEQCARKSEEFYALADEVQELAESETERPYSALYSRMEFYNERIFLNGQDALTSKSAYQQQIFDLTQYGLPDQIFGVIKIPKMELEMPLYLGASDENMANGAAVLTQTSVPIGGVNTNCVIAGHRGWNGYKYFQDIEALEIGDEVYITTLWDTLTYSVSEIQIVEPGDIDSIKIQQGRDLVTLLTCHPYASGGKYRYLVFCERVEETEVLP